MSKTYTGTMYDTVRIVAENMDDILAAVQAMADVSTVAPNSSSVTLIGNNPDVIQGIVVNLPKLLEVNDLLPQLVNVPAAYLLLPSMLTIEGATYLDSIVANLPELLTTKTNSDITHSNADAALVNATSVKEYVPQVQEQVDIAEVAADRALEDVRIAEGIINGS